jgi:hypothetical protein
VAGRLQNHIKPKNKENCKEDNFVGIMAVCLIGLIHMMS